MLQYIKFLSRYYGRDTKGLATLEFALLFPVMVIIFVGLVETSSAFSAQQRTTLAANTLADLVAQEVEVTQNKLDDLFVGVEDIISENSVDTTFRVIALVIDPDNDEVIVHWSSDNKGGIPYAPGSLFSEVPRTSFIDDTSSLIIGEIEYTYTPTITRHFVSDITFKQDQARWPRRSLRVQFCKSQSNCTK